MARRRTLVTCLALGALALLGAPSVTVGATPTPTALAGTVPGEVAGATLLGPRDASETVTISVGLRLRGRDQLLTLLRQLNDPSSPRYRQYLSLQEMNDRFNPTVAQEQQVSSWLQSGGLQVTGTYANHLMVGATGSVAQVESLLGVRLNRYRAAVEGAQTTFFAPDRDPVVAGSVAGIVSTITGLDSVPRFHTGANGVSRGSTPYYPQDLANAYDVSPLWDAGATGTGQSIGITLWTVPPADATLRRFGSLTGAAVATQANRRLKVIRVDGGTTTADSGEAGLDIEMTSGMAPGATINYYEAPTDAGGNPTAQGLLDALNLAGSDGNNNREISNSWGGCEADSTSDPFTQQAESIFASNGATGHNYFFSSGDNGSWCDPAGNGVGSDPFPDYPASSPNVVSVGGTTFRTTISGGYPGETGWVYSAPGNGGTPEGSGGGYSLIFARPTWQNGTGLAANAMRGYPDVAAVGDPNTGVLACYGAGGQCAQFGGTSVAAPLWAGVVADVNGYLAAQGKPALGFLPSALYTVATQTQAFPAFHDVTSGTNGVYAAGAGWDAVTGWGSPDVWNLARDLAGTDSPGTPTPTSSPTLTATATSTASPTTTATVTATASPTATATSTATATPTGAPVGGLLVNGGFENGLPPWQTYSRTGQAVLSPSGAHSGQYGVVFCAANGCDDRLWQTTAILPAGVSAAALTFWLKRASTDRVYCGDRLQVSLRTAGGSTLTPTWRYCNTTSGWTKYTLNVASYLRSALGQPVQVYFQATTNATSPTTWSVDDLAFTVASAGARSSPTPTAGVRPTASPTPTTTMGTSGCPGSGCVQTLLTMLNADRAAYGVRPLTLNAAMTSGSGSCVGAYGHSVYMARVGAINHNQFPADICSTWTTAGENVGESNSGNELTDLQVLNRNMMAETVPARVPGCSGSHACTIINPAFRQVGIGIYQDAGGTTWLTEDFSN